MRLYLKLGPRNSNFSTQLISIASQSHSQLYSALGMTHDLESCDSAWDSNYSRTHHMAVHCLHPVSDALEQPQRRKVDANLKVIMPTLALLDIVDCSHRPTWIPFAKVSYHFCYGRNPIILCLCIMDPTR